MIVGEKKDHPQTEACTPRFLDPQTPLLLPHPDAKAFSLPPAWPGFVGLDAEDVDRSLAGLALSFEANPKPNGEGNGVVDRCLFKAGFGAWLVVGCEGREPIGPTEPMGAAAAVDLEDNCREEGESAPGEVVDVTG